ncbi:MAG: hypothetical protein Crog4KO_08070 [Crocinitomicaceae bacterium]
MRILLPLIFVLFCGIAHSHSLGLLSLTIEKNDSTWFLHVSMSTHGLENLIQKHKNDASWNMDYSEETNNEVAELVGKGIELQMNKMQHARLVLTQVSINDHASEFVYEIRDVTVRPEFWEWKFTDFFKTKSLSLFVRYTNDERNKEFLLQSLSDCAFRMQTSGIVNKIN